MTRTMALILALALSVSAGEEDDATVSALGDPAAARRAEAFEALRQAGESAVPALRRGLLGEDAIVAASCADLVREGG
ncbi:MAG: hypothetical protein MUE73_21000, partial [Planctomycetes bacterium]|nr:hypothetical protein [Planctomycetota bacterium]